MKSGSRARHDDRVTGIGRLGVVVFDAADIEALAAFYAALTGWTCGRHDPGWITLENAGESFVAFQRAPDHVPPRWPGQDHPQQFHLDFGVDDLAAAVETALGLGASRLADGPHHVTLADPAGHPFDLAYTSRFAPMSTLWIHIDAPETSALGAFYSQVLGMPITHDTEVATAIADGAKSVVFQPVEDYTPPRWPDPAYPQQAHLDVHVADLDAAQHQVLALGATPLADGDGTFRVFADPAGHPFCLVL